MFYATLKISEYESFLKSFNLRVEAMFYATILLIIK